MLLDQHHGRPHCGLPHEDLPRTQGHGQDACQVSETIIIATSSFLRRRCLLFSPDGEVIITNDGATILEKMEVSFFLCTRFKKMDAQDQFLSLITHTLYFLG